MSKILKMIKSRSGESIPATIRIPPDTNSSLEALMDQLAISKQELVLGMIEDQMELINKELRINDADDADEKVEKNEKTYFLLNTNQKNDPNAQEDMLTEGIAAAYYPPWMEKIENIKKGDVVFLYQNGKGVIACGKGSGKTLKKSYDGIPENCYYQKLIDFQSFDERPISAKEVKKKLKTNIVFLRTMTRLTNGSELVDLIPISR